MNGDFTTEELHNFTVPALKRLYRYYFPGRPVYALRKADLIAALPKRVDNPAEVFPPVEIPPMSVRIKRIYESAMKEKQNG